MTTAVAEKKTYKCGSCGETGHNARKCPEKGSAPKETKPAGKVTKLRVIASKDSPKVKKLPPKPPKAAKAPKPPKAPKAPKAAKAPKPPKAAKAPKLKKAAATDQAFCAHDKVESFEDEAGGGIFTECLVCKTRGPLKRTVAAAQAALLKIKVVLAPATKVSTRSGSTRKKLDGTDKMRGYVLEDKHVEVVKQFTELCKAEGSGKNYSEAMRHLLSGLTEKDLKRFAKVR